MPEIIQQAFRNSPLLQHWYEWGVFVGFICVLSAALWLFVDAQRNGRDDVLWKSLAVVASVLFVPAILARLHGGIAWEMRDSLSLIAYLSMFAVVLVGGAAVAYAVSGGKQRVCPICHNPQQPGWTVCPYHEAAMGVGAPFGTPLAASSPFTPIIEAGHLGANPTVESAGGAARETMIGERPTENNLPRKHNQTVFLDTKERPRTLAMLLVTSGEYAGTKLDLTGRPTTVGSGRESDLVIDDDAIASPHLNISFDENDGVFVVTDLDSAQGTFVNGKSITKARLQTNDIVRAGRTQLQFIQVDFVRNEESQRQVERPYHLHPDVQFTVYRPRAVRPAAWYSMLAFAHLSEPRPGTDDPDPIEEVQAQARHALGGAIDEYQHLSQDSAFGVPREGELTFVPTMPGVDFNPPRRSFLWIESVHREDFRLRASPTLDGQTARGSLTVYLGRIVLAQVSLRIRVDSGHEAPRPDARLAPAEARPYRRIFPSYSHRDVTVVEEFERYARALDDNFTRDVVALRSGEVWNDRLLQLLSLIHI